MHLAVRCTYTTVRQQGYVQACRVHRCQAHTPSAETWALAWAGATKGALPCPNPQVHTSQLERSETHSCQLEGK